MFKDDDKMKREKNSKTEEKIPTFSLYENTKIKYTNGEKNLQCPHNLCGKKKNSFCHGILLQSHFPLIIDNGKITNIYVKEKKSQVFQKKGEGGGGCILNRCYLLKKN